MLHVVINARVSILYVDKWKPKLIINAGADWINARSNACLIDLIKQNSFPSDLKLAFWDCFWWYVKVSLPDDCRTFVTLLWWSIRNWSSKLVPPGLCFAEHSGLKRGHYQLICNTTASVIPNSVLLVLKVHVARPTHLAWQMLAWLVYHLKTFHSEL